jgi:hypothetical protein
MSSALRGEHKKLRPRRIQAKEFFMKAKGFFGFGTAALLLALGLVLAGCPTDSGGDDPPDQGDFPYPVLLPKPGPAVTAW